MGLKEIEREVRQQIREKLNKLPAPSFGIADKRWYYMAPLFMDGGGYVTNWLNSEDQLATYDDSDEKPKSRRASLPICIL